MLFILCCVATGVRGQQPQADAPLKPPSVKCLAFSPDGKLLAVVYAARNSVVIWDVDTHAQKRMLTEKSGISSVAYSPSGQWLAIGMAKVVKLLDPKTGEVGHELAAHKSSVHSIAFSPDGKLLASGGNDRTVNIWNVSTGEVQRTIADFRGGVGGVSISPDGKWLATTCGTEDAVKYWSLDQPEQPPHTVAKPNEYISQAAFSPDSRLLALASWTGSIAIVDVPAGNDMFHFSDIGSCDCSAFSPDGKWLALATQHRAVYLLPVDRSANEQTQRTISSLIEKFQDDDYNARELSSKQLLKIGLAALPQLRANLESPAAEVRVRCRRLVEQVQQGDVAVKLMGHEVSPNWVAFSPDGKLLASGDWQGVVKLWSVADAKELATLEPN